MEPFTIVRLMRTITCTRPNSGVIATYKLVKNSTISVLVLPPGREPTPDQLEKIRQVLSMPKEGKPSGT